MSGVWPETFIKGVCALFQTCHDGHEITAVGNEAGACSEGLRNVFSIWAGSAPVLVEFRGSSGHFLFSLLQVYLNAFESGDVRAEEVGALTSRLAELSPNRVETVQVLMIEAMLRDDYQKALALANAYVEREPAAQRFLLPLLLQGIGSTPLEND